MESTRIKEVMTLEYVNDKGQLTQRPITAKEVVELIRHGGDTAVDGKGVKEEAMREGKEEVKEEMKEEVKGEERKKAKRDGVACGDYREALARLRHDLPLVRGFGVSFDSYLERVPKLFPSAYLVLKDNQYFYHNYSGIVCLDIMNVYTEEERAVIRRAVQTLPMTLMAFVGSSGMTMNVLVRVRPVRMDLIQTPDDLCRFIALAYRQMRTIYGNVIPQIITQAYLIQVQDGVRMSYDPDVVYCPNAQAAIVDPDVKFRPPRIPKVSDAERELRLPVPVDVDHRDYYDTLFAKLFTTVREAFRNEERDPDEERDSFIERVAERAAEMKIDESEVAARIMRLYHFKNDKTIRDLVRKVYALENPLPTTGHKAADTIFGLQQVLFGRYEFIRNSVNGATFMRPRNTFEAMRLMTKKDYNTLVVEAMEAGIQTNINQVESLLESHRVDEVDMVKQYIDSVRGTWDGTDRIEALARRIPTRQRLWPRWFHVWFCAMVRQWVYPDKDYANQVMPILTGAQGIGKSTFCRRLLPPRLASGYIESGDLTQESTTLRSMSIFQLINIDEFNRYSKSEQEGIMKTYIQRADIRVKRMYKQSFEILQRRASFIATCNPTEVLADQTGSRRYICVDIKGIIQQQADIDYDQLYAQAIDEVDARRAAGNKTDARRVAGRCYFTKAEERAIELNNLMFMKSSVAIDRFNERYEPIPQRPGRMPQGTMRLTREELFTLLDDVTKQPLGKEERSSLYNHLDRLCRDKELIKKREDRGYVFLVKARVR